MVLAPFAHVVLYSHLCRNLDGETLGKLSRKGPSRLKREAKNREVLGWIGQPDASFEGVGIRDLVSYFRSMSPRQQAILGGLVVSVSDSVLFCLGCEMCFVF